MSLFVLGAQERLGENKLIKIGQTINWQRFEKYFKGFYKKEIEDKGGKRPYDVIKMFKAIILGQWYSLSDPELEESLRVRLDFMLFTGFELGEDLPDETTLCRFRNRIMANGVDKKALEELNNQLEKLGLKIKKCMGAIIDATIIASASRANRIIEIEEEKVLEEEQEEEEKKELEVQESADRDARWLKKGKKSYFGYRGYVRTDEGDGYIETVEVRPANESEIKMLEKMAEGSKAKRVYADKGFASKENRKGLKRMGYRDGIMEKAYRGKELTGWQKLKNRLISMKRFVVERTFGTLKRQFKIGRASYRERWRVEGQMTLKAAFCYNLHKAGNIMSKGLKRDEIRMKIKKKIEKNMSRRIDFWQNALKKYSS